MFSMDLMIEMGRRAQPDGLYWRPDTAALAREAGQQAAYCLDAPDDIPAGGMYADEVAEMVVPMQMVVDREPPNVRGNLEPTR